MSNSCFRSLNVIDFHNVPCRKFELLLFNSPSSRNIINMKLISHKSQFFGLKISNALQSVSRIERVLRFSNRLKFDTLWLGSFNIVDS
jgi:hypothetical protein